MESLDKIHEYIKESTMILIINNNSKLLLEDLYNSIYKKYPYQKSKITTGKGLMKKISIIKQKFVRIDLDLSKVQLSSSNSRERVQSDFKTLKDYLIENNSKIIFKNNTKLKFDIISKSIYSYIPLYYIFDLVIFIDKKEIKITKNDYNYDNCIINIDSLIRKVKLKKLKELYKNKK